MRSAMVLATLAAMALIGACSDQAPTSPRLRAGGSPELADVFTIIVPNPADFVEISAGSHHTCARQFSGDVYCWGWNQHGQVGTGESDPFGQPQTGSCLGFFCVVAPTFVLKANQIDAGAIHTCALSSFGQPSGLSNALCWGEGSSGELGNGSASDQLQPMWVSNGLAFRSISAGQRSTCAVGNAGIHCWGEIQRSAARPVLVSSLTGYVQAAVGSGHACARWTLGSWSDVECWGENNVGQTGQDPIQFPAPQPILGTPFGNAVGRVSTSGLFTCVDQQSGVVNCVGENGWGQLGNGSRPPPGTQSWTSTPQTVSVPFCKKFFCYTTPAALHGVSTGWTHACALDVNGAAYCWGNGSDGQLGNGGRSQSSLAVPVAGGHTYRAIAAGSSHTCAIGTDNIIYCWGDGSVGQLGTGLFSDNSTIPKPTAALRAHRAPPFD